MSSGASSDISYATNLARDMVTRWGMSDELGPLQYAEADEEVFLGYSVNRQKNMSNETAQAIDKEIRRVVEQGYERAKSVLNDHRDELETLAKALLAGAFSGRLPFLHERLDLPPGKEGHCSLVLQLCRPLMKSLGAHALRQRRRRQRRQHQRHGHSLHENPPRSGAS